MAIEQVYKSDMDDSVIPLNEVVTITVERQGETKVLHVTEDQFGDLLDETDTFSSMYLSD